VYTLAIVGVDTSDNESATPNFITATLPNPRLGNVIEFVDEQELGWPGTLTDCVVDLWSGVLVVRARDQADWTTVPGTWDAYTRWVWDPVTTFTYATAPVDFGAAVAVLPVPTYEGVGDMLFEVATSPDGTTWSAWAAVASPIVARYVKSRVTVSVPTGAPTGPGVTPVCVLTKFEVSYVGKVSSETGNDLDTSTLTGIHRIGVGDIRLPIQKTWIHISRVTVTLQNVGAGWTWSLMDKDGTNGPEIRIFNGSLALADALIDWTIEGIST